MNYMKICYNDSTNGHGFRTTLFVSGCDISPHCDKCFNSEAWNFESGNKYTEKIEQKILDSLEPSYIAGVSILGGEPISNVRKGEDLTKLVKRIKEEYPNKTIYVWTGFTFEEIIKEDKVREFLRYIDMLRDGRYIHSLRNLSQYLEGSSNQRYIDVQSSLQQNKIVEFENWKG